MPQYCSGCVPIQFLPFPETVLTESPMPLQTAYMRVLHHAGVYIFLGFAYQKFPMHGDCAAALAIERLASLLALKKKQNSLLTNVEHLKVGIASVHRCIFGMQILTLPTDWLSLS